VNIKDCDFTLAVFKAKKVNVYLQSAGILLSMGHLSQAAEGLCHM